MLLFDFSDKQVKVLELSPKLLGGEEISTYLKAPLKEGLIVNRAVSNADGLAKEVLSILQKGGLKLAGDTQCVLSLHDERVFTLRLKIDSGAKDVAKQISAQVDTFLPETAQQRVSSFKSISDDKAGEIQFIAADKNLFSGYLDIFKALGLNLVLAAPESYAVFWLLKPQIGEGETVVYLNAEALVTDAVVMDRWGVLQTFSGGGGSDAPEKLIREVGGFMKSKWARILSRIWVGGEAPINAAQLSKNLGLEVKAADQALTGYPLPFGSKAAGVNRLEILHLLGFALLSRQKDALNLVGAV